jgi:hypothetical protein
VVVVRRQGAVVDVARQRTPPPEACSAGLPENARPHRPRVQQHAEACGARRMFALLP